MKEEYKDGEILIIVDWGSGINQKDIGKKVKYLADRPKGRISNDKFHSSYDIYFEYFPMIDYSTKYEKELYGNCRHSMVKRATPDPIQEIINQYEIY